jgi:hypothetical protein
MPKFAPGGSAAPLPVDASRIGIDARKTALAIAIRRMCPVFGHPTAGPPLCREELPEFPLGLVHFRTAADLADRVRE